MPKLKAPAQLLFSLLGHPAEFNNHETAKSWTLILRDTQGESMYDDETFDAFLRFVFNHDTYAASYLKLAKNPAACLKKHLSECKRGFESAAVKRPSIKPEYVEFYDYDHNCPNPRCCKGLIYQKIHVGKGTMFRSLGACPCHKLVRLTKEQYALSQHPVSR